MRQELPDLGKLTGAQKDALIVDLFDLVKDLRTEVVRLTKGVEELEGRLAKDSHNSSKPPSTEGLRKPKSQRKPSGKKPGGQKGHPGSTLRQVTNPDRIVQMSMPDWCDACGAALAESVETEGEPASHRYRPLATGSDRIPSADSPLRLRAGAGVI